MMEYEDFSLKIEAKRGEVYPVSVLHSPAGEAHASFQLPFAPDKFKDLRFGMGDEVRRSGRAPQRHVSPAATRKPAQLVGDLLFNSLFTGPVRALFDQSLGLMHGRQCGLRIKLHIDPEDPSLAQLASLPWEFLYREENREFLNLSLYTPIVRYLDVQRPYSPLPLEPPLRILVVISNPDDYPKLDLHIERARIEASWATQEAVQVDFLDEATIEALQDRLREPYHVLHFMGHGDFDERSGEGVIVMKDEDGCGAMVSGEKLGTLLRDVRSMRLVFLNACETATLSPEEELDPFAGVATATVMSGVPAVVAMQFPISDYAAGTFARQVYPLLAHGYPVDYAVTEARKAVSLAVPNTMEWGTPVLFMRAPNGIIFQAAEPRVRKEPADRAWSWQRLLLPLALVALMGLMLGLGIVLVVVRPWPIGEGPAAILTTPATVEVVPTTPAHTRPPATAESTSAPVVVVTSPSTPPPSPAEASLPAATPAPTPSNTHEPIWGEQKISPIDNAVLLYVPAGAFTMGRNADFRGVTFPDERPEHEVMLDAFWIDKTEVTNSQYAECVKAKECVKPDNTGSASQSSYYGDSRYADYPVIYVSWIDATAYCRWAGRRLPTEAQWEKAARGTDSRTYPWGDESPNSGLLNTDGDIGDTTNVLRYLNGASPYGALDMAGNVWEWVMDWYEESYYANSPYENPKGPSNGTERVLRGGSWSTGSRLHAALRGSQLPTHKDNNLGFRCADLP
jgi:formylglycine-generating enzyme required for sulfatase activity